MALETYQKEQDRLEKEEKKKAGIPEEPEDNRTLKEIMNDKEESELLGIFLKEKGEEELSTRLLSGKMEGADLKAWSKLRKEFSGKMRSAENVKEELTLETVNDLAKKYPEIKEIVETYGGDSLTAAVQEEIKKMSITDPSGFKKISKYVENVQSFKNGEFKKLNESVDELCKKQGVNADEYLKRMAISNFDDRQKALTDLVKGEWDKQGGFGAMKKALDWLTGSIYSTSKATTLESKKHDISEAFRQLDEHKKKLGSVLAASIKGNSDLLEALSRETVGIPKKKETVGMNDVKKELPTEESMKKLPEDFKKWRRKQNITDAMWAQLGDAQKDPHRDNFLKEKSDERKKAIEAKGGFWASIFSAIFGPMFTGFDKKSLN